MTARPRSRRSRRGLAKPLVGVFLALAGALAPIEAPGLPEPLDSIAGPSRASAQTGAVTEGDPQSCPAPGSVVGPLDADGETQWDIDDDDESRCVLVVPPCLAAAWGSYLERSVEYPEFCEITVPASDPNYSACRATTGAVVLDDGLTCRIIQNAVCPSGVRVGPNVCRTVQRRTWTCDEGVPRNEFNTCFVPPTDGYGEDHPACGPGSPTMLIVDCAEYVGDDFVRNPEDPDASCASLNPPGQPAFQEVDNEYWCRYDSSLLDADCHSVVTCDDAPALCLKRASKTGGCSVIAKTLHCRSLQASLAAGRESVANVRAEGCEPCVILPFQSVPASCPQDLSDEPRQIVRYSQPAAEAVLREERDIAFSNTACFPVAGGTVVSGGDRVHYDGGEPLADHPECAALDVRCDDPSPGRLAWASNHFSQLAVVNSSITIQILDVPTAYIGQHHIAAWRGRLRPSYRTLAAYPEPSRDDDNLLRIWNLPENTEAYNSVPELAASGESDSGECALYQLPVFKVTVRELWPDNPADEQDIEFLFGADALAWWDSTTDEEERRRRTGAQGLEWWPDLTTEQQSARIADTTEEVLCDNRANSLQWCRWRPNKSGYYKLIGAGAWLTQYLGRRQWKSQDSLNQIDESLGNLVDDPDDENDLYDRIRASLENGGLTPNQVGINDDLSALLPVGAGDQLFADRSLYARCPPLDVRVACTGVAGSGNYVETEPIGIAVHQIRVSTVKPSN